ncbi:MAG: methyltransferase domain-containing protein [Polyangiaceae bacterium]
MRSTLVCPGCRTASVDASGAPRLDVRTLEREGDLLACACGRRYPVVDGVPVVLADPSAFLSAEIIPLVERELPFDVAALLAEAGPDDAPYPRLLEHLSTYLDAHWGDAAEPPTAGGLGELVARIAARRARPVAAAVELGCSAGRILRELAATADEVVGVDLKLAVLRRARRILAGEPVEFARREVGRHYARARLPGAPNAAGRVSIVCGDALDPPLLPGVFGRVVALNLLDSVRSPRQLLSVVDALCAPGGEVILSSPYTWQSDVTEEHERFGGIDPARALTRVLTTGADLSARYDIEEEAELPWNLRRDARSELRYRVHYVRATKRSEAI